MPTRPRSPRASAQKQPWALRYSGQMPGCMTKVPHAGTSKTAGLSRLLQRASISVGANRRTNAVASREFGLGVCSTSVAFVNGG